jgi:hypothetical protein
MKELCQKRGYKTHRVLMLGNLDDYFGNNWCLQKEGG